VTKAEARQSAEARSWVAAFWNAKESYDFNSTRSAVGIEQAFRRMVVATDELLKLEVPLQYMPTWGQIEGAAPW
jgi:hypothetical protein